MLKLRDEGRAGPAVKDRIGKFPGWAPGHLGTSLRTGSPATRHARAVWIDTAAAVGRMRTRDGSEQAVGMAFVQQIARHARECRRCAAPGALDVISSGQWLLWALDQRADTRRILAALGLRPPSGLPRAGQRPRHR